MRPLVLAAILTLTLPAAAQVQFLSATRTVYAAGSTTGNPPTVDTSTSAATDGWWEATASVSLGYAHQRSYLGEDTVEYHAEVGAGGGAGHYGQGLSTLTVAMDVASDTRWDLTNMWIRVPVASDRLVRESDGQDMFAGVDWYAQPGSFSGYLTAGRYTLSLRNSLSNAGFSATQDFTLAFTVPAPATLTLPAAALVLARRRRSR